MKSFPLHSHLPKRSLLDIAAVLVALSFFTSWFFRSKPSVEHQQFLLQRYVENQQQDALQILKDTALLRKLVLHAETPEEFRRIHEKQYGLFVFAETINEVQDLVFWNKQDVLPPAANFEEPDGIYFRQLVNGYYIVHKSRLALSGMSSNMIAYVLIPVLNQYYIQTQTSPTRFVHSPEAIQKIRIASQSTEYPIRSVDNTVLFYIEQALNLQPSHAEPVTLIFRMLALALLLVYLHLLVEGIRRKKGAVAALAWLVLILTACRVMLYLLPELLSLRQLSLFDPTVYASDSLNRSLGDLLISAFFLCWIVVYAWTSLGPLTKMPSFLKGKRLLAAGTIAVFILIFITFQLASVIYDLVANSKISFDVTNFFALNIYTAFGFLVLALLMLTYYYFSRLLFRFILLAFPNLFSLYLAVAVIGLLFLTIRTGDLIVLFYLPVLLWLVLYTLLLTQEQLIINRLRITVAGILFWIFVFSISLSVLIMQANQDREWRGRQAIAAKYDRLTEPTKERTLSVALAFLTNDFLRNNFQRFYHEPENSRLRDSFINTNLLGYANSYNTDFYVFDSAHQPVNNRGNRTYEELNNILEVQSKPAGGSSDLYYYETSYDEFIYITRREVRDSNHLVGTLFIVSAPKHFETADDLYPNFFRQEDQNNLENSPVYDYAIYRNGKLLNHSSKYGFSTQLTGADIPSAEFERRENGENTELWYKAGNKKIIVIAKKKDSFIESITLFSYLFCAFLFMVGIIQAGAFITRLAKDWRVNRLLSGLSIRTQIHGTIIFISVLSFLVIGAATISFFIIRYNRNNIDRLSRTATGAAEEMEQRVNDARLLNNNVINFSDSLSASVLGEVIREIAEVHGMIVNIYDLSGNLRVTSDEPVYQRGLLSTKMHPKAFYALNTQHKVQLVQDETINQWEYQSIYIAIRNTNGDTYAFLNVPSINTQVELKQEISNFIVTIINLNAFIFLIAGVIALFITNRITRSFSVIGDKMKAITLGKANEEIVWTRNDEIGELVTQYNKMVRQLEQSANALAKSEREGAWREMARQVAHEIKNPLTPMKLSIQYLQRAIQTNQPNVQQLTSNVAATLIEQIDHLSKIAADFSQFANIGNKKLEQVDLHSVIRSLVDLYASNPQMKLQWHPLPGPQLMYADKTQLNRLFTNLLSNAVDACSEARSCAIVIGEQRKENEVIVSISDNGEGIPEEMQSKIFTPNFTTKTSGTGLGLAMCKSIVEQAGGAIWFETKEGEGTTFFVRLPLFTQR